MDNIITKINIFSNSDKLLKFLKTKEINNYAFYFEPMAEKKKNKELCINDGVSDDEIGVLIINSDLLIDVEKGLKYFDNEEQKWFGKDIKGKYDYVFLYGKYQPIYNEELDIHFKDFNIFKDFFEVFYYLLNGVDYCSIDIRDIIYSFGSRPYNLKCFTSKNIDEIIDSLNKLNQEIHALMYIEKVTESFSIYELNDEIYNGYVRKILTILDNNNCGDAIFYYTAIFSHENNEYWKKLFVI
ncbi:hypothetical protein Tthe_0928 [Thermoanaerobacterium thermosaccharolyticum DSM 571]|uniref:Uncharacterized protein n=1 Tax=Thermoanaerobacterium thermosaccharolyticum (strain ATCC 7956 / DSM 571 / NCIMB 9385 / NCA 3814 / NCTC 13789 / WDCM 00135 / 2032) TaxID=580327 RepID=D9TMH6_THETC|nr:hypothetical protein [Thermoanaerobacterium thermosaccharolyticum]ADL68464.1 hypothetical protein Tthe_0928 [Thermoanaerobacterium thermosaccharolyticum DSM 571]